MMEEHWMRGWQDGHQQMSADLDRGFKWLGRMFGRFVDAVTPSHAPGQDIYFTRAAAPRRAAKAAVPTRNARRH